MRSFQLLGEADLPVLNKWIKHSKATNLSMFDQIYNQDNITKYTEFEEVMIEISEDPVREIANAFSFETCEDRPYYESVYYKFKHLLYQYEHGWITSKRQLVLTSSDCLSTIHLVVSENDIKLNCFQRSSNIDNALSEDIKFLCFLLMSVETMRGETIAPLWRSINLFISIPHTFGNTKSKVEQ